MRRALRILKRFFQLVGLIALALLVVCVVNTLRKGHGGSFGAAAPLAAVDANIVAEIVRLQTVSHEQGKASDPAPFVALEKYLEETYPQLHTALERTIVNEHGLVFRWKGKDAARKPILLAAHQDVVPVEPGTEGKWTHPPFSGDIEGGFVWGRGAMDDKSSLVAICEAVELLAREGFVPARTVYLAFGFDEEIGGRAGATQIAADMTAKGLHFEYVLDEGGLVTDGVVPDLPRPAALVAVTEKGYVSLELTLEVPTGHSSMPPPHTAVGILAAAVERLELEQMPARLTTTSRATFERLAPEMPFGKRLFLSNMWLFEPLVIKLLSAQPAGNATLRTTTAVTMIEAGVKDNVLPSRARAVVNFRILPGDSVEGVVSHVRGVIADDRIHVNRLEATVSEPSPESPIDGRTYASLERAIHQFFPNAVVAPSIMLGASDARHYASIADGVYHFAPFVLTGQDLPMIHGTNERCSVEQLGTAVHFYVQLLRDDT